MDRTAFRIQTFVEADNHTAYWLTRPVAERLLALKELNMRAFRIEDYDKQRVDRSQFRIRHHGIANLFNPDFQEFIAALNAADVRYILIGGYAVNIHGYSRSTGDMNIWVATDVINYQRLTLAFQRFGMPVFDMSESKFLATARYDVFTFGNAPFAIDILTKLKGLDFDEAYPRAVMHEFENLRIRVLAYKDLLTAKKAAGRYRDLNDIERLEAGREEE